MAELDYWIWLSDCGLRPVTRSRLLQCFGSPREIFRAARSELLSAAALTERETAALEQRSLERAAEILRRCGEEGVSILTLGDPSYPERLSTIPDAPAVLYYKGRLPAVDLEPLFTVVGTRKCTPYGEKLARKLAFEIASGGGTVVTGLAGGIDSLAAESALRAGGSVIGVLGCAINEVYPRWNGPLYEDVQAVGALLSEYPPDTELSKHFFPERDRIMAALSVATVVVEAPERSGSLITAHRAVDYGRDVYAVPGNADAYASRGCLQLLREGASVAVEGRDVLSAYEARFPGKLHRSDGKRTPEPVPVPEPEPQPPREDPPRSLLFKLRMRNRRPAPEQPEQGSPETQPLRRQLEGLTETQLRIVGVMDRENMHVDDIVDLSGLPAATVTSELTMMQIKGYVNQSPGKRFSLNLTQP